MSIYAGSWSDYGNFDAESYETGFYKRQADFPREDQIVYAAYETPSYDGYALIVWKRDDGTLMENNDSHCSCYGLERWEPEETSKEALLMRVEKGSYPRWPRLGEALEAL